MMTMQKRTRIFLVLSGLAMLSACASDAEKPAATPLAMESRSYHEVLESAYTKLAEKAFGEMDWIDAYRFQNKATQARKGRTVEPDNPKSRSIAVARDPDIQRAYRILRGYLQGDGLAKAPADLAVAQAAYDCWIENAEESETELVSGECRRQYEQALRRVEDTYIEDAMGRVESQQSGNIQ